LLSSVENIAQAPRCGSIFSFCSENKKLGTWVTAALFWVVSPASSLPALMNHRFRPVLLFSAFILPQHFREFWT
jgi:hypothetical protein